MQCQSSTNQKGIEAANVRATVGELGMPGGQPVEARFDYQRR